MSCILGSKPSYLPPLMNVLYPITTHTVTAGTLTVVKKSDTDKAFRIAERLGENGLLQDCIEHIVALVRCHLKNKSYVYIKRPTVANTIVIAPMIDGVKRVFVSRHTPLHHNGKQDVKITQTFMLSFDRKGNRLPKEKGIREIVSLTFAPNDPTVIKRVSLMQELNGSSCFPHNFAFIKKQNGKLVVYQQQAECDLETLEKRYGKLYNLPEPLKITISKTLISAVSLLHSRNILHRDIKPSNILVVKGANGNEEIKLTDFGLSCKIDDLQAIKQLAGSLLWSSAEKLRAAIGATTASESCLQDDVWGVGAIMYLLYHEREPAFMQRLDEMEPIIIERKLLLRTDTLQKIANRTEKEEKEYTALLRRYGLTNHTQSELQKALTHKIEQVKLREKESISQLINSLNSPTTLPEKIVNFEDLSCYMLQNQAKRIRIEEAEKIANTI